jgi:hypothetical protein
LRGQLFPRRRRAFVGETHDVIADDGSARVADAEEVPAVARRCDACPRGIVSAMYSPPFVVLLQLRHDLHVHRQLAHALADSIEERGIDALAREWLISVVLDADEQRAAGAVREADAGLREIAEVGGGAGDFAERLAVEVLGLA